MVNPATGPVKAPIASTDPPDFARSPLCQEHLVPFLKWLLRRHKKLGGVTEIRAIAERPTKAVWSGYFDPKHLMDLVEQILPDPDGPRSKIPYADTPRIGEAQFYFTMQPANPALLARSAYTLGRCDGTSDKDIIAYHLFGVDLDPLRPAGISSTDEEKAEARKVARKVGNWLKKRGIGFISADSGNGYHLLVPTVPYKDVTQASANAHTLLKLLQKEFSTDKVSIDTTIYNPSRILKLYGTKAVKGSDLPERPHRYATVDLSEIPDDVDVFQVLHKELDAFRKASEATKASSTKTISSNGQSASSPSGWDFDTCSKILHALLTRAGFNFKAKDKDGHRIFNFRDCPYHTDPDGQHYECAVMVRAEGGFAAKCMHDEDAGWKDFKAKIGWDTHIGGVLDELGIPRGTGPYQATPGGIVHLKPSRDGPVKVPLTNFAARIINDVAEDDGAETRHVFEIEATLRGRTTRFHVPAQEFAGMNWPVEHLGAQAVVHAGHGNKEHARAAIQLLSGEIPTQTVYTHLGWRKHVDQWVYLHAGGAIGPKGTVEGVRVRLTEPFTRFVLPELGPKAELQKAVRASIKLLELAPDHVTVPLFAGVWRAAAGTTDFSLFLAGPSGTFKTALAALVQQHWGAELDAHNLPANWSNTANHNEALAFLGKDAVLVVDDFAPAGSQYDVQKMHREADRLLRGQGNQSGRGRMRADTTLRPPRSPRGMILSTGEDVPRGQSLQARIFVLEVSKGMVDPKRLTWRQRDAGRGLYATALSGFVRWLARHYEWVHKELMPDLRPKFRELAAASEQHRRTPTTVADFYLGLDLFVRYAEACEALTDAEGDALLTRGWLALGQTAAAQASRQSASEPVQRFLDLLNAALATGKAHVAGEKGNHPAHPEGWGWRRQGDGWHARGDRVGWLCGDDLYLEPEAAFKTVQEIGQAGGEPLAIGSKTLHKRLDEKGLLASTSKKKRQRLQVRKTLEGRRREVLHLHASVLWDQKSSH